MITIATTSLEELSAVHRDEIVKSFKDVFKISGSVSLYKLAEQGEVNSKQNKFYLGDIPVKDLLDDITYWDSFVELLSKIFDYAQQDIDKMPELQYWITSLQKPLPVNIFYSIKNKEDIADRLSSLRDTLQISKVFEEENIQKGKVVIVAYDNEGNAWRINYL